MSKWIIKRLDKVLKFYNGKICKTASNEIYPVYGSNGKIGFAGEYNFENAIIIGRVGAYCGSININTSKFWASDNTIVAKSKPNSSIIYLNYMLQTMKLNNYAGGSAQPLLNQRILKNLKIQIPDLKTQEKIADLFSTYDELIENNNRRIEILEKTAEEIYKEWFVRMRFPGYEKTKFIKGIPEGWEVRKAEDVISFDIGGGWGKETIESDFFEKAYVIRGTDIPDMKYGKFNYELLRFHKESNLKNRKLKDGDIIFEASGGSSSQRLGRTIYINHEILSMYDENVIPASFCKLIRINNKESSWLFNCYLNYAYEKEILSTFEVQSTGISNFGFTSFKKHHTILMPNRDLIEKFYNTTYKNYQSIVTLCRMNQNLIKQRDLLLPRLMNGTIEVK